MLPEELEPPLRPRVDTAPALLLSRLAHLPRPVDVGADDDDDDDKLVVDGADAELVPEFAELKAAT